VVICLDTDLTGDLFDPSMNADDFSIVLTPTGKSRTCNWSAHDARVSR